MVERMAPVQAAPSRGSRMKRIRDRSLPAQPQEDVAAEALKWKVRIFAIFIACLLIPGSFFIAGAKLSPYRAFLLIAFLPLLISFVRGAAGRITSVDVIFILYGGWLGLSMIVHLGFARIDYIIIQLVEAVCGYLIGRVLVRNAAEYKLFFRCFLGGLLVILPFGLLEMLTKTNLVSQIAGMVLQPYEQLQHPPRLGLHRAQTSFEHPILFGLFCSLAFANALCIFRSEPFRRVFWTGVAFLSAFTAMSSAPLLAILAQIMMLTWDSILKTIRSKWFILIGLGGSIFGILELVTPNGAIDFLISNFTLVPATAEYRLMTNQYVLEGIAQKPFFGFGPGSEGLELPWWHTGSIDNFWLKTALDYGLPGVTLLLLTLLMHLWRVMMATGLNEDEASYRAGHFVALAGVLFLLMTVHVWGGVSVMIMTYVGAGAWIYAPQTQAAARKRHLPARSRAVDARPVEEKPSPPLDPLPQTVRGHTNVRGSTGRYGAQR
jgi:O-antigen ligase